MNIQQLTPTWHIESYEHFIQTQLPQLLGRQLPLAGYRVASSGDYTCTVTLSVTRNDTGEAVETVYTDIPQPDEEGKFLIDNHIRTVVPLASSDQLDSATIYCVGDLLLEFVEERLGSAPSDLPWDEAMLRAWLPLDRWLADFFTTHRHAQVLDHTNWLANIGHTRRLIMLNPSGVTDSGQFGRLGPFEKPEGPNMGRIGTIAVGATIYENRLVAAETPLSSLGITAYMTPLAEQCDPNRLLMGLNMQRQWLPYANPEPALVQSGHEPDATEFWCGRNLLTAFVPWGAATVQDGIILSESGAIHLSNVDHQVELGDKLSNRYGAKGVVSAILPDAEMPRMADGTPVELLFSGIGLHSRLNTSQLREAVLGRLARSQGEPIIAPPFAGPTNAEIQQRLAAHNLPQDGMETLIDGLTETPLERPATVGWVYWGRTAHLVRDKLYVATEAGQVGQRVTELSYRALRAAGAEQLIHEFCHTLSGAYATTAELDGESLLKRASQAAHTASPSPRFQALCQRLQALGITIDHREDGLHFGFQTPPGEAIQLVQPVPHPWLQEHLLTTVGGLQVDADNMVPFSTLLDARERQLPQTSAALHPGYKAVVAANAKLARLLASDAPTALTEPAYNLLVQQVDAYAHSLLVTEDLHFSSRVFFSARTVLAPSIDLAPQQIGLGDEVAWALYGPQVAQQLGDAEAVQQRTERATQALDALMAESWLLVNRAPALGPTAYVALRPVRQPGRVARIHFMICPLMDADFDGDQCSLLLPITPAAQREAGERLSLAGHLRRDPALLNEIVPSHDAMLGLALLSLQQAGRGQIDEMVGTGLPYTAGFVTRAELVQALAPQLTELGADRILGKLHDLYQAGFAKIRQSGCSLSPFVEFGLEMPNPPAAGNPQAWQRYVDERLQQITAMDSFDNPWGHYVLATKCGALAENRLRALIINIFGRGVATNAAGEVVEIRHGFSTGLLPEELFALVPGAQEGLRQWGQYITERSAQVVETGLDKSFHVLARARRSTQPGLVFARAAAIGEIDPLVDVDSRMFMGK